MTPESMDVIFQALGSATRRRILDIVKNAPGCNVNDVCAHFDMSRIAVMKHLRLLETADLIVAEKKGRDRRMYFNAIPIQMIYDRWTTDYSSLWATRLTEIKYKVESGKRPSRKKSKVKRKAKKK
ncbi:MAG: ArsR family transcriptional regulator [Phycisphaerales bacterium]|nr:ArsR family transcriptional regulator [Phycisphaerales bacterium]